MEAEPCDSSAKYRSQSVRRLGERASDQAANTPVSILDTSVTMAGSACSAVVLSSIGQLRDVSLGYFVKKGDYDPETFEGPLELLSVSGIISRGVDGYTPHLHAVLGEKDKRAVGGHLISGEVVITNETVLQLLDIDVSLCC